DGMALRIAFLEAEDVVLDPLEGGGRDRRGLVLPGDQRLHVLDQFRYAHAGQGTGRDRTDDAVSLAESIQVLRRQRTGAAIRLRGNEDDGAAALRCLELREPEADAVQRVAEV